ncbi:MAG TPA: hypothetical protein VH951_06380 [Dehalococcoidia bacterium]
MNQHTSSGIRRAEIIAAISLAADLASGEPLERSIRSRATGGNPTSP